MSAISALYAHVKRELANGIDTAITTTGLVTAGTLTVTGATTLTGGIAATAPDFPATFPLGSVAYGSLGSDLVHVAGTRYFAPIFIPGNRTLTGIGNLNGSTDGTHKLIYELHSSTGALLATTAVAGTLSAGTDVFQEIAFTATYAAKGPAYYWIAVQAEGTTPKTRRIAASTFKTLAGSSVGVFGTSAAITVPTTFTADMGPIAYVY